MKTAVKDATLSDTEAIYLACVILGVAWLLCDEDGARLHLRTAILASEK